MLPTPTPLRAHVVRSAVRVILDQARSGVLHINDLGVSAQQIKEVAEPGAYLAKQRPTVVTVVDAVAKGVLHVLGLPVIDLSSEYYGS